MMPYAVCRFEEPMASDEQLEPVIGGLFFVDLSRQAAYLLQMYCLVEKVSKSFYGIHTHTNFNIVA